MIQRTSNRRRIRPVPRNFKQDRFSSIPLLKGGDIRIVPLGGVEEVGRNMTAIETSEDIIIIDAGMEFADEDTPGIDYIIPNTTYLEKRKEKIRGLFITHGHYDHIGAIPHVMPKIGNPLIYSRQFGAMIIQKRQTEFPDNPPLKFKILEGGEIIKVGRSFKITTFSISHTIPDSMGLIIETGAGEIVFVEDVRVDNVDGIVSKEEEKQYSRFKNRKILLLAMDSTSIEKRGFSLSEETVVKNLDKIIKDVKGRIIIGSFASQVERIVEIIKLAEKYNKKVVVEGRSMKTNVEITKQLKLVSANHIIPVEEMEKYPANKILMLATGSQGEEFSALVRMANKTHRQVKLTRSDTILLSASIIPGNERTITKLKDGLYRSEAKIITYLDSDIHASGHGNRAELEWIHKQIDYKFFIPIHGHHYMLRQHADMAQELGTERENIIVPDNGSIIEIREGGKRIVKLKETAPSDMVLVDGFSVGNTQNIVVRDRKMLAQDGIFVIVAIIDSKTGHLRKSPDIISRGFVYLKEEKEMIQVARNVIKQTIEKLTIGMNPINLDYIKSSLIDNVSRFLLQKTAKRPLIIPVLLNV